MVYVRGHAYDYDRWEKEGAEGWSYADCLPYFRKSQTHELGTTLVSSVNKSLDLYHLLRLLWVTDKSSFSQYLRNKAREFVGFCRKATMFSGYTSSRLDKNWSIYIPILLWHIEVRLSHVFIRLLRTWIAVLENWVGWAPSPPPPRRAPLSLCSLCLLLTLKNRDAMNSLIWVGFCPMPNN